MGSFSRQSLALVYLGICSFLASDAQGQIKLLHEFAGTPTDGKRPEQAVFSGSKIVGLTSSGGGSDQGVLFTIDTSGRGYRILHNFSGKADGSRPRGIAVDGKFVYGMSRSNASTGGEGTIIYKVQIDGSGFQVLSELTDAGYLPESLIVIDSSLYGSTGAGGGGRGAVFRVNINGKDFKSLHAFTGQSHDGETPGELTSDGATLYGITVAGGKSDRGTVFRVNGDGTEYRILHEFSKDKHDGSYPSGGLVVVGSQLYGTTPQGGALDQGCIFTISTAGNNFRLLHSFETIRTGGMDGRFPRAGMAVVNSRLIGTTHDGGEANRGTVFSINLDGSGYKLMHSFKPPRPTSGESKKQFLERVSRVSVNDGAAPVSRLIVQGSYVYGTTEAGGSTNNGTVFRLPLLNAGIR